MKIVLKLSKLQRWILRAALDLRINEDRDSIQYWEIKKGYFHLPLRAEPLGWVFSKHTPGYNAAAASLSRTAKRLEQRRLARVRREGLQDVALAPTTEGFAVAAAIELGAPRAFGFKAIKRGQLERLIRESERMSPEERFFDRVWGREG